MATATPSVPMILASFCMVRTPSRSKSGRASAGPDPADDPVRLCRAATRALQPQVPRPCARSGDSAIHYASWLYTRVGMDETVNVPRPSDLLRVWQEPAGESGHVVVHVAGEIDLT